MLPEKRLHEAAPGVMRTGTPLGGGHDLCGALRRKGQRCKPVGDGDWPAQRALPLASGPAHDFGHPWVTFQPGDLGAFVAGSSRSLVEAGSGRQLDTCLAQRRQHLVDVAQESGVWADDQDALDLEGEPVRVEEVGRPVQRDRGLTRTGATLDDEDRRPGAPG